MKPIEIQILTMIANGDNNDDISFAIDKPVCSMSKIRERIYKKLGAKNAPSAIYQALRKGIIQ